MSLEKKFISWNIVLSKSMLPFATASESSHSHSTKFLTNWTSPSHSTIPLTLVHPYDNSISINQLSLIYFPFSNLHPPHPLPLHLLSTLRLFTTHLGLIVLSSPSTNVPTPSNSNHVCFLPHFPLSPIP